MKDDLETLQKWAAGWERADKALLEIKAREMQAEDYTVTSLQALSGMFELAIKNAEPSTTSGLVEMQRYFALLKEKNPQA